MCWNTRIGFMSIILNYWGKERFNVWLHCFIYVKVFMWGENVIAWMSPCVYINNKSLHKITKWVCHCRQPGDLQHEGKKEKEIGFTQRHQIHIELSSFTLHVSVSPWIMLILLMNLWYGYGHQAIDHSYSLSFSTKTSLEYEFGNGENQSQIHYRKRALAG